MDLVLFSPVPFDGNIFLPNDKEAGDNSVKSSPPNLLLGIVVGSNQSTNSARTFQIRLITNAWENFKSFIKPTRPNPSSSGSSSSGRVVTGAGSGHGTQAQNKNGFL